MSEHNEKKPFDTEVEEALAFAASLRAVHTEDPAGSDPPPAEADLFSETAEELTVFDKDVPPPPPPAPDEQPTAPESARPNRFWRFLYAIVPVSGDGAFEITRKLLFLVALLVFIGAASTLLNESVIIPQQNKELTHNLKNILVDSKDGQLTPAEEAFDGYPEDITDDFKKLYYINSDVRGWLSYKACNVDNVVMYSPSNDYYLYRDIYKNQNKNGSLYFDRRCNLSNASATNKSLVIYGHNMASGQMFAGLNRLASSIDTMKRANAPIQLQTLYATDQYKIFAVVVQDSHPEMEHYYSIQDTSFRSNADFMRYVQGLRDRSLYDFPTVDVNESDEILILYTCCPKSVAGFEDARLGVIARKVRPGESAAVDSASIRQNEDVIMPYAWYVAKDLPPHSVYRSGKPTDAAPAVTDSTTDTPTDTPTGAPTNTPTT